MSLINFDSCYSSNYTYDEIDNNNQHMVVYSGGCDSTLLLYELAKKYGTKDKPVLALSYNHHGPCQRKIKKEKETRKRFKKYCRENKLYVEFYETTITTNLKNHKHIHYGCDGIIQPYLWLGGLGAYALDRNPKNIYLGYIKHDDFYAFKSEFIDAFNAMQKIVMTTNKLYFPYMWTDKKLIIDYLKDYGIYDYTWHCETPTENYEACGSCIPCQKHKEVLILKKYLELQEKLKVDTKVEGELEHVQ